MPRTRKAEQQKTLEYEDSREKKREEGIEDDLEKSLLKATSLKAQRRLQACHGGILKILKNYKIKKRKQPNSTRNFCRHATGAS